MLSLGRLKAFDFVQQASVRREFSAKLAVQKQNFLFSRNSTCPPSEKGVLKNREGFEEDNGNSPMHVSLFHDGVPLDIR